MEASWFKATPDSLLIQNVPTECGEELAALYETLRSRGGSSNFRAEWPGKGGLGMRIERIPTSSAEVVFLCRRFRIMPGKLTELGMPDSIAKMLLAKDLKEGLVVFFGKAGAGKSTTAGSFVIERTSTYGGACWTVENPIELPLQGRHGNGVIYQTEVSDEEEMGPAICRLYRATPNIIMVGEARDSIAVREAIKAGSSGHLVVLTFHAPDLITGLGRLARLADEDTANVALSDALKVAIHLSLHNAEPKPPIDNLLTAADSKGTGTPPRLLSVQPLCITGEATAGLKSIMKTGDYQMLNSEIDRQRRVFMMGKLP